MTSIPITDLKEVVIYCLLEGESDQDTAVQNAGGIIDTLCKEKGNDVKTILAAPGTDNPQLKGGHAIYIIGHGDPNGFDGTLLGGYWEMKPAKFVETMENTWSACMLLAAEVYLVACDIGGKSKEFVTQSYAYQTAELLLSKKVIRKITFADGPVNVKFTVFDKSVSAAAWYNVKTQ